MTLSVQLYAFGSKKPSQPDPEPPPVVTPPPAEDPDPPTEDPAPINSDMSAHYYLEAVPDGFEVKSMGNLGLRPECLRSKGADLIILDGGHDDSSDSTRSDAKVRGGNGNYVILWPEVHEEQLNMLTAWLAYDLILKDSGLTATEREELQTMIRFTRHPGERSFGQYDKDFGYYSSTQGTIDSGVTNRKNRTNFMMQNHRAYDSARSNHLSSSFKDVTSRTVMISVHANSSDYYYEGDVTWVIPGRGLSSSTNNTTLLQSQVVNGMTEHFGEFFTPTRRDDQQTASYKEDLQSTVTKSRIITREHSTNLAMLSTGLGNSNTAKLLLEGFVMNGKAGYLARKQILDEGKKLLFKRNGALVQSYNYSDLYLAYAQSIVQGISDRYGCH